MNSQKSKTPAFRERLPPFIHIGFTKKEIMLKTFVMMSIIATGSIIIMGINALFHILIAMGTMLLVLGIISMYQKLNDKPVTYESPYSTIVAGMIVGLSIAIASPFYITAVIAFITIVLFKYGQKKWLKYNYINPAAGAKALVLGLLSLMLFLEDSLGLGQIFHPHHLELNLFTDEGLKASMWIFRKDDVYGYSLSATEGLFFWQTHGWIGGACGLLVLVVGLIAVYWLRYKWRIVASAFGSMVFLAVLMGLITQGDVLLRIAFHVFTGSFIFMVFFMATEPQSTPLPEKSQIIFGTALAVLSFILQLLNVLGGSIFALVFLNMLTPYFDKIGHRKSFGMKQGNQANLIGGGK